MCENRRLTVRKTVDEVGLTEILCYQIVHVKFEMRRISAKFVLHLLTNEQ